MGIAHVDTATPQNRLNEWQKLLDKSNAKGPDGQQAAACFAAAADSVRREIERRGDSDVEP